MERPSRSDARLSNEEASKIEGETRDYFDGIAPHRHAKPQRSEYSSKYNDAQFDGHEKDAIPEYLEFQHLEKDDPQKLVYKGTEVAEEFVETEYYKDLTGVDKQHHTTGTGFIKMDSSSGKSFSLDSDSITDELHASCKGNPATNDWIPASGNMADFVSDKPGRSEN
ncbi:hypothetical protein AgCh_003984 [Apium graveolens]